MNYLRILLSALVFCALIPVSSSAQCTCDATVTEFNVDLSASTDTVWTVSSTRNGYCCGATGSTNCIRFNVTVHPQTTEIGFNVANPSPPGGAFYQVDCGAPTSLGTPLCVTGLTTFCITFCKSGGDSPTYTISASRSFEASPDVSIHSNCSADISVSGLDESSIVWTSINPGNPGDYDGYLSCTAGCDTTTVTPQPGYPPFIDYEVSGTPTGCASGTSRDTVRVYITDAPIVTIDPNPAFVCFGQADATLTANVTSGSPPYTYNWSTGETTQSITVGAGTYWVEVMDTSSNCPPVTDTVVVTNASGPITANAGSDVTVCSSSPDVVLNGSVTVATGGTWTGGTGTFNPDANTLNATYTPSAAEIAAGTVTLTLSTTGNGGCTPDSDQMTITIQTAPTVNAGADQGICEGDVANLAGTVTGGAGTGQWSTSGTGTFSPSSTDLNASYTPSASDISAGSVTLTLTATAACSAQSDQLTLTITPQIIVNAGADQTVCAGSAVNLSGSVTGGSTTGTWTTSGSGTFAPSTNDLNAVYTPSAADEAAGTVTLTLTSTNNGGCTAVTDDMVITIQQVPVVNAGADQAVCEGDVVALSGTVTGGAGTGQWSTSGSGTFSPSNMDLNASYTPSASDISAGTVTLTLSATASCASVADAMTITITPQIIVNAGADQSICQGDPVNLSGSVTGGSMTGTWTTSGSGTFSPSANDLNATYSTSAADEAAGTVTLTLTSTNNGGCAATSDDVVITIQSAATVSAGADQAACEGDVVTLLGSITGGSGVGEWSTSGTGTFAPSINDPNATYTPSAADATAGSVTLTFSSPTSCNTPSDAMTITITPQIIVNAGADQAICQGDPVNLGGSVTGGSTTGTWSTSGSGTFSPSASDLNATYTTSAADESAGTVTLTLTSTNNGGCAPTTDDVVITIQSAATVSAGADQAACEGDVVNLSGSITGGSGVGEWSTSGSGTFAPSINDPNATYTPSAADATAGSVTLTFSSPTSCNTPSDAMTITITPQIIVDAGADQIICIGTSAALSGSVTGGSTTGTWTTSGSGTFSPSANDLNATYNPSAADESAGTVTLTLTSTNNVSCSPVTDQVVITILPPQVVDAGSNQTICAGDIVSLSGSITGGPSTGVWTTSGSGTFSPSNSDLNASYTPSVADETAGSVTLTLTSTGGCTVVTDQVTITILPAPLVNAGADITTCANNAATALNGSVTVGGSGGIWTTSGSGTFSPSDTDLNATYNPSAADITAGTVTITLTSTDGCTAISDDLILTITPAPVVDAGADQSICANNGVIALSGSVTGPTTTGTWTTSGSGTFSPSANDLNATYTASAGDTTAGSVTITLTSTNNGSCLAESDNMTLTFTPAPNVSVGSDITVCANNATVNLSGTVTGGASTGVWSTSGNGTFSPSNTDLNPTYTPGSNDIVSGSATITLTSTNNGTCLPVTDQLIITITPAPVVSAGPDQTVCQNNPDVSLSGSVTGGSTTGQWTTSGTGTFVPSSSDLNATYQPSAADTTAGTVTLVLTSTSNGNCLAVTDTMIVTITSAPTVDAGPDVTICANNTVGLSGSVIGFTTTGQWTTSGSGTFSPSNVDLNATYIPSAADTTAGSVTITLTSTNNANCSPVSDNMTITFTSAPVVNAGTDIIVCANNPVASLSGAVSSGFNGIWTTSGSGTFSPSDTDLNADYTMSPADTAAGSVELILTSTNNGTCIATSDTMLVTVISSPIASAGSDQFVCIGDDANLSGNIVNGSGTGQWSTTGSGTFTPSNSDLNATYTPSAADYSAGSVQIILESTNNGSCLPDSDTLTLTFTSPPTVDAGSDLSICANETANLSGAVSGTSTTGQWSTAGDGTFNPNAQDLNAEYIPGPNDIAAGSVTLTLESTNACLATDQMTITITSGPIVDAGTDQIICLTDNQVVLSGSVSGNTTTGQWSSTGSGTFSPNDTDLNGTYNVTAADSTAGTWEIILTSTNNGACAASSDTMVVTMTDLPVVDAGADTTFCANNVGTLNGSVTGGTTTGQWSTSGTGTFSPSDIDLNATYVPSAADVTAGSVTITLSSTGACVTLIDDLTMTITPGPSVDAGADDVVCVNDSIQLSGSVMDGSTTGQWTTNGNGSFSPNDTDLNAYYVPGAGDLAAGTIEVYLTSTNNGDCLAESDTLILQVLAPPTANAGGDLVVCSMADINLSGTITGGGTGQWSTNGSGTFANANNLNTTYTPTTADTTAGSIEIYLESDPSNICGQDADTIVVQFLNAPVVDAGIDTSVCANNDTIQLSGTTSNGMGIWSTVGDGVFTPSDTLLNTTYLPGSGDSTAGFVEFILSSANTQGCPTVTDTMVVDITPAPLVDAGGNQSICLNNLLVTLNGSISGGSTTGYWSTNGTGMWIPDSLSLGTNYQPSSADTTAGAIWIALTSTNNGSCLMETDTIQITFDDAPMVNAGLDVIGCQSDSLFLFATISGGGAVIWTTDGAGSFAPDSSANPVAYMADASDTLNPFNVYATYTNGCGSVTDTVVVTVLPSPGLSTSYTVDCETFETQFDATINAGTMSSISWDFGDGNTDTISNPTNQYSAAGSYTVTCFVSTSDGCTDSVSFTVNIEPLPIADFIVSDSIVSTGDEIVFTDTSTNDADWWWDFDDGAGEYNVEDTTYVYDEPGTYIVELVVANNSGCTDTTYMEITVTGGVNPPAVPGAFTPNGDGNNDILFVRGGPFKEFELRVFNEWGNEVFQSTNQSVGWDGNYKGKEQPSGVYIYVFKGIAEDDVEYDVSGDFTLIR